MELRGVARMGDRVRRNVSLAALAMCIGSVALAAETTTFRYDALGRLGGSNRSGSVNNGVTTTVSYDAAGNRTNYAVDTGAPSPSVSIAEAATTEGGVLTFSVSLSAPSAGIITIAFGTLDGSALAGSDYSANSGTLTFAPGETSKTISVFTNDDLAYEGNESFSINLESVSGATVGRGTATGTIVENDPAPVMFAVGNAAAVAEGGALVFTVTKGNETTGTTSINYATANGTAAAGSDYSAGSGTLTFAPGETAKTVSVQTIDDAMQEASETVLLSLSNPVGGTVTVSQASGTINDNDQPSIVTLNPGLSYNSANVRTISITTLANLNGLSATIASFTVPSGKGTAVIASGSQSVTYTAATVAKPGLCEPATTISFAVPYTIRNSADGAIFSGSATIYVTGPAGSLPTGGKECP